MYNEFFNEKINILFILYTFNNLYLFFIISIKSFVNVNYNRIKRY